MKEWTKNIKFVILTISLIAILPIMFWIIVFSIQTPNTDNAEKYFNRDKTDIVLIVNYFADSDITSLYLHKSNFSAKNYKSKISDEKVLSAITKLFEEKGYNVISINGNTIYFQKWTQLEFGAGIAYSINKEDEPILQYLTKLEPLSESGWYFYEENYNEWRTR